jgi:hypothetical protein
MAAAVLFLFFVILVARSVLRGEHQSCHCFGELTQGEVSWAIVARNMVLFLMAVLVALAPSRSIEHLGEHLFALISTHQDQVVLGSIGLMCVFQTIFGVLILSRVSSPSWAQQISSNGPNARSPIMEHDALLPTFRVIDGSGARRPSADIVDADRNTLMIFVNPKCASCEQLFESLPSDAFAKAKMKVVILSRGSLEANESMIRVHHLLNLFFLETSDAIVGLGILSTPSAIVVSPRFLMVSEILSGPTKIAQFIHDSVLYDNRETSIENIVNVVEVKT